MNYSDLLVLHSWTRWLVLLGILWVLYISKKGRKTNSSILGENNKWLIILPIICIIQLTLGFILYSKSPFVQMFFQNYPDSLHQREFRFFGLEHSLMMPISIGIIIFGSIKAYKFRLTKSGYKIWFRWILTAFILIIVSIPWSFWPLVSRPLFRLF